jgi:tRNA pseudouridine65 synthase
MSLEILYSDQSFVAINKPSGLLVHRSELAADRITCMSLLRDQLGRHVYPVHRLDRGASGVLVFALDAESAATLARAFADRTVSKEYLAIVRGWAPASVEVDYPLDDEEKEGSPRVDAQTAIRRVETIELPVAVGRYPTTRYSLVEARPHTGRRHQIRRHLAHLRHPIIGDRMHGDGRHNSFVRSTYGIHRLLLHGHRIEFEDANGCRHTITAGLPADLGVLFDRFGWPAAT